MEHSQQPRLVIRLFGPPEVELDGVPVRIERQKTVALLAYLALTGAQPARESLAALFWPDCDAAQAGAYLRRSLWELRQALGQDRLEADRQTVALVADEGLWVDVACFRELLAGLRGGSPALGPLADAVGLYRGDLLAGFSLRDSPDFDDWQTLQAEALRRDLAGALAALAQGYGNQGDWATALAAAQRWLALDPLDEAAHRALMRLYAQSGQRAGAIRQYEACVSLLREELDAAPEAETTALYDEIRAGRVRRRQPQAPVLASAAPRLEPALPAESTPFVGRDEELAQIARLLADPECRLLTLVGPGGVGKTRLAIQAARAEGGAFPDGVAFVPLAGQGSAEGLVAALAGQVHMAFRTFGSTGSLAPDARGQLLGFLRDQALLLVLDNVEHLAPEVAALLAELLPAAPRLKLLVTSRERLKLPQEWVLEVEGLPYPAPEATGDPSGCPAVRLFLKVAQRVSVGFAPGSDDWPAIAGICRSLEGMPLAIELAASWVRALSCPEIAGEIEHSHDFLASQAAAMPGRHRSLRAVFEHSWGLLSEPGREVYARLAGFAGGFTRQAALQVAGAEIADLSALLDRSLLRRDRAGRYDLHQVLKQYAAEKLALSPEAARQVRARHSAYYLDWLAETGEGLRGREQRQALRVLLGEIGNLQRAWQLALAAGDWQRIRRALPAWALFTEMGPRRQEGFDAICAAGEAVRAARRDEGPSTILDALLALLLAARRFLGMVFAPGLPPEPLVQESLALAHDLPACEEKALAFLLNAIGPAGLGVAQSQALAKESQALFEAFGDPWGAAMAQLVSADVAIFGANDGASALPGYLAARRAFQALGNRWGEALCLFGLTAIALQEGRYGESLELGRECIEVYRELGNPWRIVETLTLIGQAARAAEDLAAVRTCLLESLAPLEQMGCPGQVAWALARLGELSQAEGDLHGANSYLERALAIYRELEDREGVESVLSALDEVRESRIVE